MSLKNRLATLLRADAHGVVEALEDKALVLQEHLRQARLEVDRKRCRLQAVAAEDRDLETRQQHAQERLEALEQDVALALASGEDDLARFAMRKLLVQRHGSEQAGHRRRRLAREHEELAAKLAEQQDELTCLEQRVRDYLARRRAPAEADDGLDVPRVSDEEVEIELLRRRQSAPGGG